MNQINSTSGIAKFCLLSVGFPCPYQNAMRFFCQEDSSYLDRIREKHRERWEGKRISSCPSKSLFKPLDSIKYLLLETIPVQTSDANWKVNTAHRLICKSIQ